MQSGRLQAKSYSRGACARHVHNHQVLRVSRTKLAVSVTLSQIGRRAQLMRVDTSAQHCRANVVETGLLLPMDTNMVAEYIVGRLLENP